MILDDIAQYTQYRYEKIMKQRPLGEVKAKALSMQKSCFEFEKALRVDDLAFICEVKKASPSKGIISEEFPYLAIAKDYQAAGANAVSCLTEPKWFMGDDEYLVQIANNVSIPILRKDFTLYEYQLYEAKIIGASAVLLICALLDGDTISRYIQVCDALGLSALVEAHDEFEINTALEAGARVIGVNNRNLKDFTVDVNNSSKYRRLIPDDIIFVSESGIKDKADIDVLRRNHTNAVLIGETLMKSSNIRQALTRLINE